MSNSINDDSKFLSLDEMGEFEHVEDSELDSFFEDQNRDQILLKQEARDEDESQDENEDNLTENYEIDNDDQAQEDDQYQDESETDAQEPYPDEEELQENNTFNEEENFEDKIEDQINEPFEYEDTEEQKIAEEAIQTQIEEPQTEALNQQEEINDSNSNENLFQEVQDFSINFNNAKIEGSSNPPFTLIIDKIRFKEDANYILETLKKHSILTSENEHHFQQAIKYKSIIIPRISEYATIFLAHKFRNIEAKIKTGLSAEIYHKQNNLNEDKGLISKINLYQNKSEELILKNDEINKNTEILISTSNTVEGYLISQYLDIISSSTFLSNEEMQRWQFLNSTIDKENKLHTYKKEPKIENNLYQDTQIYDPNMLHSKLINDLKNMAFKMNASAIIGIQFNLTPILNSQNESYKLTTIGTAVKLQKYEK